MITEEVVSGKARKEKATNTTTASELYEELGLLLQVPDSSYISESDPYTCEWGLDTNSRMPGLLGNESSPTSNKPSSSSSESSFDTCKSSFDTNPSHQSKVARKKTYIKTRKKKAPDEFQGRALATQRRPAPTDLLRNGHPTGRPTASRPPRLRPAES